MTYIAGSTVELPVTFTVTATGQLADPGSISLLIVKPDGSTLATYTYPSANIIRAATGRYRGLFTPGTDGQWQFEWTSTGAAAGRARGAIYVDAALEDDTTPPTIWAPTIAFAQPSDLAAMVGVEFTDMQATQAEMLLDLATLAIIDAVDKDEMWAADLNPVPGSLKLLCLSVARRVMVNPGGVRSKSEQLGQFQHSESYADQAGGITLTNSEVLQARRTVYGVNTASVRVGAIIDDPTVDFHYASITLLSDLFPGS